MQHPGTKDCAIRAESTITPTRNAMHSDSWRVIQRPRDADLRSFEQTAYRMLKTLSTSLPTVNLSFCTHGFNITNSYCASLLLSNFNAHLDIYSSAQQRHSLSKLDPNIITWAFVCSPRRTQR